MPTRNSSTANICWGRAIRKNFLTQIFSPVSKKKVLFVGKSFSNQQICLLMCTVVSKYSKKFLTFSAQKRRNVTAFFLFVKHFSKRTCDCSVGGRFFKCANLCFGVFRRDTPLTQFVRQPQNMACNGKRFN